MTIPAFARKSPFWLIAWVIWFATLWHLSSGPIPIKEGPEIPHLDKVAHFGYFFGGSGLLCAFYFTKNLGQVDWTRLLVIVVFIMVAVGCLDEWHQSWHPERTGNDSMDLTADIIGTLVGFLVFRRMSPLLKQANPSTEKNTIPSRK